MPAAVCHADVRVSVGFNREWPKPFKLNKDASLAVLGRDIQPKAQDKILRLGLPTALGLDGLKAWVKERQHSIQPVHEEPLVRPSLLDPFLLHPAPRREQDTDTYVCHKVL